MVSIGKAIYDIQRHPLLKNVLKSDIVNYIKTVINLIGAPGLYEDKNTQLTIADFRSLLPADFISRIAVRKIIDDEVDDAQILKVTLTHNTDDAFKSYSSLTDEGKNIINNDSIYTHKIVGDYIYTDFEEGTLELIYKAFSLDENNYPVLDGGGAIGDTALQLALEWYVKREYFYILWTIGKIAEKVYQHAHQQSLLYIGQATNAILIPDPIEAEAIGNSIVRLIPQTDNLESGHKYDSQKERIRR